MMGPKLSKSSGTASSIAPKVVDTDRLHEQRASAYLGACKNRESRGASLQQRPPQGWAIAMPKTPEGENILEIPSGFTAFDPNDPDMLAPVREKPEEFDDLTSKNVFVALTFPQLKCATSGIDSCCAIVPWVLLDDSLTFLASTKYTNAERYEFWPRNFDTSGNPRKSRPAFGRPPRVIHGYCRTNEAGEKTFYRNGCWYLVHKRWVPLLGDSSCDKKITDERATKIEWKLDEHAWSFGTLPMEYKTDSHRTGLDIFLTIPVDRKMQNLPESIKKTDFWTRPVTHYTNEAIAARKLPFPVNDDIKFVRPPEKTSMRKPVTSLQQLPTQNSQDTQQSLNHIQNPGAPPEDPQLKELPKLSTSSYGIVSTSEQAPAAQKPHKAKTPQATQRLWGDAASVETPDSDVDSDEAAWGAANSLTNAIAFFSKQDRTKLQKNSETDAASAVRLQELKNDATGIFSTLTVRQNVAKQKERENLRRLSSLVKAHEGFVSHADFLRAQVVSSRRLAAELEQTALALERDVVQLEISLKHSADYVCDSSERHCEMTNQQPAVQGLEALSDIFDEMNALGSGKTAGSLLKSVQTWLMTNKTDLIWFSDDRDQAVPGLAAIERYSAMAKQGSGETQGRLVAKEGEQSLSSSSEDEFLPKVAQVGSSRTPGHVVATALNSSGARMTSKNAGSSSLVPKKTTSKSLLTPVSGTTDQKSSPFDWTLGQTPSKPGARLLLPSTEQKAGNKRAAGGTITAAPKRLKSITQVRGSKAVQALLGSDDDGSDEESGGAKPVEDLHEVEAKKLLSQLFSSPDMVPGGSSETLDAIRSAALAAVKAKLTPPMSDDLDDE